MSEYIRLLIVDDEVRFLQTLTLLVTNGRKVVGIVRLSDVFEEVADRIRDVDAD